MGASHMRLEERRLPAPTNLDVLAQAPCVVADSCARCARRGSCQSAAVVGSEGAVLHVLRVAACIPPKAGYKGADARCLSMRMNSLSGTCTPTDSTALLSSTRRVPAIAPLRLPRRRPQARLQALVGTCGRPSPRPVTP